MVEGGDPRLEISGPDKLNRYGCSASPRPNAISFASSTASTISERAYVRAAQAIDALLDAAVTSDIHYAFGARIAAMRDELKQHLTLDGSGAEIVFSPSGTDSQLHALFVARARHPGPLTTIIVGADQTGSGTVQTSRGLHFGVCTAQGLTVEKGAAIQGLSDDVESIDIPLHDADGALRSADAVDRLVLDAVSLAVAHGRNVLLQVMDASKLGWRAPSARCLDIIAARWPDYVQIVVDACQARLGRARLRRLVAQGFMVLLTGSKFFTGPPFSGALVVPEKTARAVAAARPAVGGLAGYSTCYDWPESWTAIRKQFSAEPNFGQWLRWEAALAEIDAYYAVPAAFRRMALARFASEIPRLIAGSQSLELVASPQIETLDEDEELALQTIFPFHLRKDGVILSPQACAAVYYALNSDASRFVPENPDLASRICHIGQPVPLRRGTVLRINTSARIVSECWSRDMATARASLDREVGRAAAVIAKIEMLVADGGALLAGNRT
jgi:hypothetical protein